MNLKGLGPRLHNIYFHTHTVAGIVISVAVFIIFYSGAFALFKDEIYRWENHSVRDLKITYTNPDEVIRNIQKQYPNFKSSGQTSFVFSNDKNPLIQFYGDLESDEPGYHRMAVLVNPKTWEIIDNESPPTTIGDTLYHLHFFDQIPGFGIWLSGFVSLFLLFAIITGVIVHWKNMIRNFFAFSIKSKAKTLWTQAHTTLSLIGLPFQFVYAVTGCLFALLGLLLAPSVVLMFDGSTDPIFENISPGRVIKIDENAQKDVTMLSLNNLTEKAQKNYPNQEIQALITYHYGYADAFVEFRIDDGMGIVGDGILLYSLVDGSEMASVIPNKKTYSQTIYNLMTKLHFGTFGGLYLKFIYFFLSMVTCFSIIAGVLLWKKARENIRYTTKQQSFHHRVTKVYMAICLSLFPATGLLFLANKLIPMSISNRAFFENSAFFGSWLLLCILGLFWNRYKLHFQRFFLLGGCVALVIPIANGMVTGDWIHKALSDKNYYIFSVDIFWFFTGIITLLILFYSKKKDAMIPKTLKE